MRAAERTRGLAVSPAATKNNHVAVLGETGGAVHTVRRRLVLRRTATKAPGPTVVLAGPAIEVAFPKPMAGLVKDECEQCAARQHLQIRPRAHLLDRRAIGDAGGAGCGDGGCREGKNE